MSYLDAAIPSLVLVSLAMAFLPWVDRDWQPARIVALGICIVLNLRYLGWRVFETIPPIDQPANFTIGVVFTAFEALSLVGTTTSLVLLMRIKNRTPEADAHVPWLLNTAAAPKIDVLICSYNDDEEILERTIIGALAMTYPNYRVWVCDDGKRDWLRQICGRLGAGYLTRPTNIHAKAGNINAALAHLRTLDEPPAFVAILDADFVPRPEFLTRATALMHDPEVGVVQTPQHFFNADPIQSNLAVARLFPDEQRFFFDIVMASKDAWGAAFCCGTSSVLRMKALDTIGDFPTDSVTEDYLVSLRLRENGYQTVYLNEVLSLGLAPEGMAEYASQRSRWCLGLMQICLGRSGPLTLNPQRSLVDRIMLTESFIFWGITHTFRLLAILIPACCLLFGIQVIHASTEEAISHVLPFFVGHAAVFLWLSGGRVMPIMSDLYQLLCATDVMKATVLGLLAPKDQKFKVTAKGGDRSQPRVEWMLLRIFLWFLALCLAGIVAAFLYDPTSALPESTIVSLGWTWYNIIVLLLACYVCIEQPRRRKGERFKTDETVTLIYNDCAYTFRACDVSVSGMRLAGPQPGPVGSQVCMKFGRVDLDATIVRTTEDGFAVMFAPSLEGRIAVTRHIFSAPYDSAITSVEPLRVALAIGRRIFR